MDLQEIQVPQPSAFHSHQANQEMQEMQVHQVQLAHQEMLAKMAKLVHQVPKVQKAHQDLQVQMVYPALKVRQAHRANKEKKVCARNIALSTVAFSSKMAQGDKRVLSKDRVILLSALLFLIRLALIMLGFSTAKKNTSNIKSLSFYFFRFFCYAVIFRSVLIISSSVYENISKTTLNFPSFFNKNFVKIPF
jgi:hypothetical protein